MHVRREGVAIGPPINQPLTVIMKAQLKNAAITTAIVLATIFVLRKVPVTKGLVDKALAG